MLPHCHRYLINEVIHDEVLRESVKDIDVCENKNNESVFLLKFVYEKFVQNDLFIRMCYMAK
jgi:hypothetical protein